MKTLGGGRWIGAAAAACLLLTVTASAESNLLGDLNGDGIVNSADQRRLLQAADNQGTDWQEQSDLNGDGIVDSADAELLWYIASGQTSLIERPNTTLSTVTTTESTTLTSATETSMTASRTTSTTSTTTTTSTTATTTTTSAAPTTVSTTTKPSTTTTKSTTTTTATTKTTTTTKPTSTSDSASAQKRPTLTAVTAASSHPTFAVSPVKESVYMANLRIKNTATGKIYTAETKNDLQLAITAVVKYEMGTAKFAAHSTEAWKAQAVAAYTYIAYSCYNGSTYTISLSRDVDLSASLDKAIYEAVGEVLGIKLMDTTQSGNRNKLCQTMFFACAPGATADSDKVFVTSLPYLTAVYSPETKALADQYAGSGYFERTITYSFSELLADVSSYIGADVSADKKSGYYSLYATQWSGATIVKTNLYYTKNGVKTYVTGTQLRWALGLRSASVVVTAQSGDTLTLSVQGFGHGVGMSQIGAVLYANEYGWTYDQILAHYYSITSTSSQQLYQPNW